MVIGGGGTGGHLFPGLAVAEALRRRGGAALFIGSPQGIEARVIPGTGFPLVTVPIRGLRGRGAGAAAEAVWRLPLALARAWSALRAFRPDVVVGVGGYASFPVVCAAWLRRVPAVLLEQNARPGMTTRLLSRLARAVCTGFPETGDHLPGRAEVVYTGNPVRQWPAAAPRGDRDTFTLLVFGGSQGAHRINLEAGAAVRELAAQIPGLRVIHQTGDADLDATREAYQRAGLEADVRAFIDDMGAAYGRADLVVCRAGAMTLAELAALGKPAILIPYPFAADDHQRANAEALAQRGAAEMILDAELTAARLRDRVRALYRDRVRLQAMGSAAAAMARPQAAEQVLDVCDRIVGGEAHAE